MLKQKACRQIAVISWRRSASAIRVLSAFGRATGKQHIEVWGFNFAYMQKTLAGSRQLPAKMPVLMAELLEQIQQMPTDLPLVIAGKSMGGRVATLLAASDLLPAVVRGVIAFGYPFHPPKKR